MTTTGMPQLTAAEWIKIGYRLAAVFTPSQIPDGVWHPSSLKDERVIVDGVERTVDAVQVFAIGGSSPTNPYRYEFTLVFRD